MYISIKFSLLLLLLYYKQSLFAHKWLSYTAKKNETHTQHARNGGEKRVGLYLLDGYHQETHTAYEPKAVSGTHAQDVTLAIP